MRTNYFIRRAMILVLSVFSFFNLLAQGDAVPDKTLYETKLAEAISQHTNQSLTITSSSLVKEGTNHVLSGLAAFLGTPNVNFSASFTETNSLVSFTATLPSGSSLNWGNIPFISKVYPDKGLLKLPEVIKDNLNLGSAKINFADDGASMSKVSLGLAYA
ncbi:MAG: hypothetical protein H7Y01_07020, partial [Ferruginibacter sp.]|nr:hypothetical protein [Chitinophagaceae bacterium]